MSRKHVASLNVKVMFILFICNYSKSMFVSSRYFVLHDEIFRLFGITIKMSR